MPKRLFIKTYGCQMNVYDSERMTELLAPIGYRTTERQEEADLVVLNTCHIREKAAEKVYSELGRLRGAKEAAAAEGRRMVVTVAGCVAQAEGAEMQRRQPLVDIVVGPQAYHRLPELIARVERADGRQLDTDFPAESKFDHLPEDRAPQGAAAFLAVQEGCDKFCTFCVVPYTRGAEASRPVADLLAKKGIKFLGWTEVGTADIVGNDRAGVRRMRATYDQGSLGTAADFWALEGEVSRSWMADRDGTDLEARRRAVTERGRTQI